MNDRFIDGPRRPKFERPSDSTAQNLLPFSGAKHGPVGSRRFSAHCQPATPSSVEAQEDLFRTKIPHYAPATRPAREAVSTRPPIEGISVIK
jgi:hypothetical protein